ncbi:MAG: L-threonine 3-dehydrogenase [Sandaracinaceae bacterium]|nr:L-threonine 3-dehydrogenase [Sandaracinaceae bacterium]MDW8246780.1 L-threonine 3-dehydrogenase [Sandaracinaceae bacterium]
MRVLAKVERKPGLCLTEAPLPEVGPNDVKVRVRKMAICGTDVHIYEWDEWAQRTIPVPMHIGHEYMGEIVEVGSQVQGLQVGDRVTGEGHLTCGHCRNCRAGRRHLCRNTRGIGVDVPGAFAEYIVLPAVNVFKLPPEIPDEVAAFMDPLGNATHAALSFDLVGEDVLITGAGPIGVMAAAIAKHVGARHVVVTDINPYRLELARRMGATRAVDVRREKLSDVMHELGMKEGFDVGLEMSGSGEALCSMLEVMNHGGRVALLGIPPGKVPTDWSQVIFKGLVIKGIYGREMFETWYKMTAMLQGGLDVRPVITHRFRIEEYELAFEVMRSGKSGKVIMEWGVD